VKVEKSIFVKRAPEAAFRHFTADLGKWWPLQEGLTFGGDRAHEIFLEPKLGGRFFERFRDGEEHVIGRVTAYEPPARVVFTWQPPSWTGPTEVEVRFSAEGEGTRVRLEHRGWETAGTAALERRDNYGRGWDLVLSRYAA